MEISPSHNILKTGQMALTSPLDPEDYPMESPAPSKVAALEQEICDSPNSIEWIVNQKWKVI